MSTTGVFLNSASGIRHPASGIRHPASSPSLDRDLADLIPPVRLPAGNRQANRRLAGCWIEQGHAHRVVAWRKIARHRDGPFDDGVSGQPVTDVGIERHDRVADRERQRAWR